MKRRPKDTPYRPRPAEPLAVVETAERLALVEGCATVQRELTKDESKICIALAQFFSPQLADLEARVAELQQDVLHLRRLLAS